MVDVREFIVRLKFWIGADRLGPDIPLTHWKLHFKTSMRKLCVRKFKDFGEGSEFRPGAYAEACSKISIGKNVVIRPGTFLFADPLPGGAGIKIEDDVLIGPGVHFYTNNHAFSDTKIPIKDQGYPKATMEDAILVQKGSWIGAAAVILPGVEIGENAVVGAGTIVTKSVPPRVLFAGNPGKVIREL
jgi:acetyltransferase-like isoleucine patch superfamily enzyme